MERQTERSTTPILVVEDFEDNRFMIRRRLELIGYRVLEAVDGQEAIELAEREHPALILMDLGLPRVDGLVATRRIRQNPGLSNVAIIAVSAYDSPEVRAKAMAAGCNDYVIKPIDFDKFDTLMKRALVEGSQDKGEQH